jgi:succinoglycan biosynthesis transport protein ExoP
MELRQYWNLLRKWMWLMVLGTVLAGGTSFAVNRNMTPVYQASTTLLVTPGSTQSLDNYTSLITSERLAQTYAQLLQSAPVLEKTFERLGTVAPQDAGFSIAAEPVQNTQLISLRVTGTNPDRITEAANTLVAVFIEWQNQVQRSRYAESKANLTAEMERVQGNIQEVEAGLQALKAQGDSADPNEVSRLESQLAQYNNNYSVLLNSFSNIGLAEANTGDTITVVSPAVRPAAPIRPRVMQNTLLAAVVGGMLAVGVAFLVEYLDDTVKDPNDLAVADLNTIAAVQQVSLNGQGTAALFAIQQPKSLVSESYRTLRTNLQFSSPDKPLRTVVVTSALATEGKTTTAANLAVVMAQAGKQVVLLDGDLRRPALHKVFGLANRAGLTTALVEDNPQLSGYLQDSGVENLRVLTTGPIPPNPQELLGSQRMRDLLRRLQEEAEVVVVDSPPTLVVADANVLASLTDGVLMVVNAGHTRRAAVQQAAEGLRQVGAHLLGGVLNRVNTRGGRNYYYYYYQDYSHYYGDGEGEEGRGLTRWLRRLRRRLGGRKSDNKPS